MRPDPHKQAASRKYQHKLKNKGAAGVTAGTGSTTSTSDAPSHRGGATHLRGSPGRGAARGGARGGRGGYTRGSHGQSNNGQDDDEEDESDDGTPRKSYARRKITSNADRYAEPDVAVTEAEELEQGIDRQTMAFREMLNDADQKKTFDPAAYFRFKSEKDVENQDAAEESQQARKLLEVRLDDIEKALMTLSIKDRLFLRESDAKSLDQDIVGKVSFSTGKPIVPKLVRGQAASDILIKSSGPQPTANTTAKPSGAYSGTVSTGDSQSKQALQASLDDDLDDLLDITKTYGKAKTATSPTPPLPSSTPIKLPSPPRTGISSIRSTLSPSTLTSSSTSTAGPRKALPPLLKKKGPPRPLATDDANDEDWLDSVLG
ncbi:MAG: hypothetical protein BYD32DRAFT_458356 [Podila humilis]|nr:MAG: hypothetical protein BYD32DRAFT_458356 [Podila humilis]